MFRTLDRYILREMMPPYFMTLAVLLLVFILEKLFRLADLVVSKGAGLLATVKILIYVVPSFMVLTLPMSLLVAALTAFTTMSADSEITAMKASRISLYSMIRPVFILSLITFGITAATSLILVPSANTLLKTHLFNMVKSSALVGVEPGIFSNKFSGMVIYVDKMDSRSNLEGIFISDERSVKEPYIILAKQGKLIADPKTLKVTLALQNGTIHMPPHDENTYSLIGFTAARLFMDINGSLSGKGAPGKGFEDMSSSELLQNIKTLRAEGKPTYRQETELNKRFSIPFVCLIFGLIGAPLGIRRSRSGKSAGIAVAFMVFLVYYIVLAGATNLAETGTVKPLFAYWIPNVLMAVASALFVIKKGREVNFRIWDAIVSYYYKTKERLLNKFRHRKLS
jgi:lipopolysaccharide export system permease protein